MDPIGPTALQDDRNGKGNIFNKRGNPCLRGDDISGDDKCGQEMATDARVCRPSARRKIRGKGAPGRSEIPR